MLRHWVGSLLLLATLLIGASATAQDLSDLPPDSGSVEALRAGTEQRRSYWRGSGPVRHFLAARFELGVLYFRPTLQLGFGKPHYKWVGVEGFLSPGLGGSREYAGVRGVWPGIDVRAGVRYEFTVNQHYLQPRVRYEREDLQIEGLGRQHYMVAEAEANGSFDALGGNFFGVVTGYGVFGVPDGLYIIEEALKVVAEPPFLWRARAGYLYHLGWLGSMRLGVAGETIHLASRGELVGRVGPLLSVALTHHLEANAAIMIVVGSPDKLGLEGADIGQIGLRYRWATGDRWAEFP